MVDNTSVANSALPGTFSSDSLLSSVPMQSSAVAHSAPSGPGPGSGPSSGPGPQPGGMRLEAVMENLQRQQAVRLRQAEKELQSQLQHQALLRHYQATVRFSPGLTPGLTAGLTPGLALGLRVDSRASSEERDVEDSEEDEPLEEEERFPPQSISRGPLISRVPLARSMRPESPQNASHEWTYEEQFKQVGTRPSSFLILTYLCARRTVMCLCVGPGRTDFWRILLGPTIRACFGEHV
ncbi:hypothetical protein NQD34_006730 [Periophthalmus magnuspinnatus]|nr:hypothetical protein NQD34_006730 [Periophthalmus magnuspinnatus]